MKTEFAKQSFTALPSWAKGVVAIIVLAGLGFAGYKAFKFFKNLKETQKSREEEAAISDDLNKLNESQGTRQTLTDSEAKGIANALFAAMDGYGTNASVIFNNILQIKNNADWLAVKKAYGTRELSTGRFNPEPNFKGTLEAALAEEISITDAMYTSNLNKWFDKIGVNFTI